jgi:hypothetical protein
MTAAPRKMSEIMKEMAEALLRSPGMVPTSEAMQMALLFANVAWNETVGISHPRAAWSKVWKPIEADNPKRWDELETNDVDAMIDKLVQYKKPHYPDDRRRILVCGIRAGNVHVEWMAAAAPDVDPKWEMRLYGLVWTGKREDAIRFLQDTRGLSRIEAAKRVVVAAAKLRPAATRAARPRSKKRRDVRRPGRGCG